MTDQIKLLLRLLWQPGAAMGEILDRGSQLFASVAVIAVSISLTQRLPFYMPYVILAAAYAPGVLLIGALLGRLGALGNVFQRDYSPLATCTFMAWSAANLPLVLAAWTAPPSVFLLLAGLTHLYFAILMFFAVRTVFGLENGAAAAVVCLSWIPLAAVALLWVPLQAILRLLASPFILLYVIYYLRSEVAGLGSGLRRQQSFHRMLEAAAINPHDGEAQYQLGLIHQQRRQHPEALRRFQAAIAIDPTETDAHFQLGRIARQQGRIQDALNHFRTVLAQDEKHSLSEIHRELGGAWLAAGQYEEARRELALYIDRRPYDPEGLYYYGQVLEHSGDLAEAREMYAGAVEAVRTAPQYRRRVIARWSRLAQKQLRKLRAAP